MTITQEELKKLLHYDPGTGVFNRLLHSGRYCNSPELIGTLLKTDGKRYLSISLKCKRYLAHRLAWLYIYGTFPNGEIDHINGNGLDNRIVNIRDVSILENKKNLRKRIDNSSGMTGIYWRHRKNKWQVVISVDKKYIHVGYFASKLDAACARINANIKYGFHKNHGSNRPL